MAKYMTSAASPATSGIDSASASSCASSTSLLRSSSASSNNRLVYDPAGAWAWRLKSMLSRARRPPSRPQHVRVLRWQKPAPVWFTVKRSASLSQSMSIWMSFWALPLLSPFFQRPPRDRE